MLYGISRQAFYKKQKSLKDELGKMQQVKDLVLQQRVYMPRLGTRKLYSLLGTDLKNNGLKIGRDKMFSYLRHLHLLIKPLKSYTKTTNSKHWMHKHPNLVKDFKPQRAEQLWVSDITYMQTLGKTCYISLVTDAYSRKIMGYHLSEDLRTEHMAKALKMAIKNKKSDYKTIHHSDRGLQYCSDQYQSILMSHNLLCSMTDGYDCYQNALAERMNGILKMEFLIGKYPDYNVLRKSLDQCVTIYNSKRPHLSLNYKTPNEVHKKSLTLQDQGNIN
jgi:transposase InsO family protein